MAIKILKNILPIGILRLIEEIRRNTTGGRMTLLVQMFLFEAEYLFNVRADKYANCNT